MDNKEKVLSLYRFENALSTLEIAEMCVEKKHYRDSINRCYYAVFYAIKSVLALEEVDFKRHKDVVAYFNKKYVATEIFPKDIGRKLGNLKTAREENDYDDFVFASVDEAETQMENTKYIVNSVKKYLKDKEVIKDE